jgi:TolA-binding protein
MVRRAEGRRADAPPGMGPAGRWHVAPALALALLAACSTTKEPEPGPTIKTLAARPLVLPADPGVKSDGRAAIDAYRSFLNKAPGDPQRPEALRRLGDLEMESADARVAAGEAPGGPAGAAPKKKEGPSYGAAVNLYQELLRTYPNAPDNDRVLYQLAHAYELGGALEPALAVLDRLVREYPHTGYFDEAQFRRGELMFTLRNYAGAEQAYAAIVHSKEHTPYFERSLYMHGWSIYKQGRLEDALASFFGVLDLKLIARDETAGLDKLEGLSRADRELVEDTLRVTSLCLESLQGADSIPPYMTSPLRHDYEFRIYQNLGEMYLAQERIKDAADTFLAFVRRYPLHAQAPVLQSRVIAIYQQAGFDSLVLEAKKEYVQRYGARSEYARANRAAWEQQARPLVKAYLTELARIDHANAQKTHRTEDRQAAVHWYRELIDSFPQDPEAAQANFLLAELLFEDARYAEAAAEYEKAAYQYLPHAQSADAGYAALLAYAEVLKPLAPEARPPVEQAAIESALRFGSAFPTDPRVGAVLTDAAEKLYVRHDLVPASDTARKVLALQPPATAEQQRVAWTVIGHAAFESAQYAPAEQAYMQVLARSAANDPARAGITERLAGAVYKQGEEARGAGRLREAVNDFTRVATVAPDSPVRATAQFDAAAVLIELKDWPAAGLTLEDFRQRYPKHPLQDDVSAKLAVVYSENGQWGQAAVEFDRLSARAADPALARGALLQAADLYEKAKDRPGATSAYERYLQRYPAPFEAAIEVRSRLVRLAGEEGNEGLVLARTRELMLAEQQGGTARTDHTRLLGARAALALAEPAAAEYRKVALVEPLKKQLKLKKTRMEDALKAYAVATDYGVADVTTEATFRTAELYRDFGQALLASQRPKGLSKDELEQYDLMLEEQAYPFEEKATGLHEANARHSAEGIYDRWVRSSFDALAKLRPVRYGKGEQSEEAIDAVR